MVKLLVRNGEMMSNNEWNKLHLELPLDTRLRYWAQNEDMIDQYYTMRGADMMDAADRIEKLETVLRDTLAAWDYWQNCQEGNLVNGFSDLFANICEARAALEEKK
jgi:hypothetical protein